MIMRMVILCFKPLSIVLRMWKVGGGGGGGEEKNFYTEQDLRPSMLEHTTPSDNYKIFFLFLHENICDRYSLEVPC